MELDAVLRPRPGVTSQGPAVRNGTLTSSPRIQSSGANALCRKISEKYIPWVEGSRERVLLLIAVNARVRTAALEREYSEQKNDGLDEETELQILDTLAELITTDVIDIPSFDLRAESLKTSARFHFFHRHVEGAKAFVAQMIADLRHKPDGYRFNALEEFLRHAATDRRKANLISQWNMIKTLTDTIAEQKVKAIEPTVR
jgi:hypothetical protein